MLCVCHGAVMGWQKDARIAAGGRWECREKRREYNQRRHAQRAAWDVSTRGYVTKRRRTLAKHRVLIVQKLHALEQEAKALAQS